MTAEVSSVDQLSLVLGDHPRKPAPADPTPDDHLRRSWRRRNTRVAFTVGSRDLNFRAVVPEKALPCELERALGAGLGKDHHPVFGAFMPWQGVVEPGWDVNFLGVRTRVEYFSMFERLADFSSVRPLQTAPPVQNEDYFEWVNLLESVVSAKRRFRMIELGAGWGKWLANGAVAARCVGLDYYVVGVEAEPTHFKWMKQHLLDNCVESSKAELHEAAVAAHDGEAWFHVGEPADWYGQRVEENMPVDAAPRRRWVSALRGKRRKQDRHVERIRAMSLRSLLAQDEVVDLIDSDVQGAEADVFEAAGQRLTEVVRRVHIGTHSDENEERLRRLFEGLEWKGLNDYPNGRMNQTPYGPMPFEDGVQTWLNPRLA
jgi:FkbM family methyltransferase